MPEKFKFKYLDGEYIERLQSMVSNKLHQEHGGGSKEVKRVQNIESGVDRQMSQTSQASQTNLEGSLKSVHQSLNAEKMEVPSTLDQVIQPHSGTIKVSATNLAQNRRPIFNLKPEIRSETAHMTAATSSRQQDFDSIETSLAKITISQRAICSSINSLVPNLMHKPLLETPLDAKRYHNRFEAFLRMFTRNYAYPIELMLTDIQSSKCLPSASFIYKINSIYNILQVAMSAYAINVRNYLDPGVPPKVNDLLNSIRQTTNVCIERMLFHEDDYVVQVLLDKIDEIQMQLQNIETLKLDYKSSKVQFVGNPREKPVNHLSMYGSAMSPAKSSISRTRLIGKDKGMNAQAHTFWRNCILLQNIHMMSSHGQPEWDLLNAYYLLRIRYPTTINVELACQRVTKTKANPMS